MQESFVYIMASKKNGTIYIGITSNLEKRVLEHKNKMITGFTQKYDIVNLVYYETFSNIEMAIGKPRLITRYNIELEEIQDNEKFR